MDCASIAFTEHALQQMLERDIDDFHVRAAIREGEVIDEDRDAWPLPKFVILGRVQGNQFTL